MARYRAVAEDLKRFLIKGKLLDIGCGTGRLLFLLLREMPQISATGIDVSEEMLSLARGNAQKEGFSERISLLKGTAEELQVFTSDGFDCVLSHASFSGWLAPEIALEEIARILKPDGILYISDWNRSAPAHAFSSLIRRALNEPAHLERIRMGFEAAYSEGEFKDILSKVADKSRDVNSIRHSPAPAYAGVNSSGNPESFALLDFRTEDHWMTGVLRKG